MSTRGNSSGMARGGSGAEAWVLMGILLVFGVAVFWMIASIRSDDAQLPAYSSFSGQKDGALALYLLAQAAGLEVERYIGTEYEYPPGCQLLLMEEALSATGMFAGQVNLPTVREWVEQGNCLVVAADPQGLFADELTAELGDLGYGAYDVPAGLAATQKGSGRQGSPQALWRAYQPGVVYEMPASVPRLYAGISAIETAPLTYMPHAEADVLLAADDPPEPVLLHSRWGEGEVFWLTRPEMVANSWLDRRDNAALLLAVLDYASSYGTIRFDEHIHGYQHGSKSVIQVIFTTPGGLLLLAGFGAALLCILGLAIKPARYVEPPAPRRRSGVEMVQAQADLYQRAGASSLAARCLVDSYRRQWQAQSGGGVGLEREESFRHEMQRGARRLKLSEPVLDAYLDHGRLPGSPAQLARLAEQLGRLLPAGR